jgi:hypothetical protein
MNPKFHNEDYTWLNPFPHHHQPETLSQMRKGKIPDNRLFVKTTLKHSPDEMQRGSAILGPSVMAMKRGSTLFPRKHKEPIIQQETSILIETGDSFFPNRRVTNLINREHKHQAAGVGESILFN